LAPQENPVVSQLKSYHRLFYRNEVIKGLLFSLLSIACLGSIFILIEYFAWLSSPLRGILYYLFLSASAFLLVSHCFTPIVKWTKKISPADLEFMAKKLGKFFDKPHQDELINILQLQSDSIHKVNSPLLEAAITQKVHQLSSYKFVDFIDHTSHRKTLYGLIFLFALLVFFDYLNPQYIRKPTLRIVNYTFQYPKVLPFQFLILNKSLDVVAGEPFTIQVQLIGKNLPADVYFVSQGSRMKMDKELESNVFSFTLPPIASPQMFQFEAAGNFSEPQTIQTIHRPGIEKTIITIEFPAYIHRPTEKLSQLLPLQIPEGSKVYWDISTNDVKKASILLGQKPPKIDFKKNMLFTNYEFSTQFFENSSYQIHLSNEHFDSQKTSVFRIDVIKDQYPKIETQVIEDTLYYRFLIFKGVANDDYGLNQVALKYQIRGDKEANWESQFVRNLVVPAGKREVDFGFLVGLDSLKLRPGAQLRYYFEVTDYDGIHGPKKMKTQQQIWEFPESKQLSKKSDDRFLELEKNISSSIQKAQEIKKELTDAMNRLKLGKDLNNKMLEEVLAKEKELKKALDVLKDQQEKWMGQQFSFQKPTDLWIQKMENLQKLIDQIQTSDLTKGTDDLFKNLQNELPSNWQKNLEQKQSLNKNREKELQRLEQFYKDLKIDKMMEESIQDLNELSQKQSKLAEEPTLNQAAQKEINQEFKEQEKAIDNLEKEMNLDSKEFDSLEEEIEKSMNNAEELMENKSTNKAKSAQKKSAEGLKKLAKKLEDKRMSEESNALDLEVNQLRLLLDNLLQISFEQERVMLDFRRLREGSPALKSASQRQNKIAETAFILEDSLISLGKKVMPLSQLITRETTEMHNRLNEAANMMKERKWSLVQARQQQSMASINKLAVMLSDLLQQMQNQQTQMKPGKKGKGKQKPQGSWAARQQKLNQKARESRSDKQGPMSEDMIKIAQEQARLRQELEEKLQDIQGRPGSDNLEKSLKDLIKNMEKNETDFVNKRLNQELQNRQDLMLPILLESEKALKEQGEDPKKESKNAFEKFRESPPPNLLPYLKKLEENRSLYQRKPVDLTPSYQEKVLRYLNQFK
jgi:predicted RNA-binding Zn ribbon-like protein